MESINTMEQLKVAHMEIRDVVETIKTKLENVLNVDDLNIDVEGERKLIGQTIGDIAKVSANQVTGLKTRFNELVPLNRLPVEIFAHIILLTNTGAPGSRHPFIHYTWVCHRWRSDLIQNSAFWTIIQHRHCRRPQSVEPIYAELLRRSKFAKLDIQLSTYSVPYISTLKKLFAEESHRICRLALLEEEVLLQLVLSGKQFPSLQQLVISNRTCNLNPDLFIRLMPVLVASDSLETLRCSVGNNTPFDCLSPILNRIRHLHLFISSRAAVPPVFQMLPKLQTLQLTNFDTHEVPLPQIVLPELQFLSANSPGMLPLLKAPKLISLNARWGSNPAAFAFEPNFLSIRYLYIRGPRNHREKCTARSLCVLGAKDRVLCGSLFSQTSNILYENPSTHEYARDCFHLGFETFGVALQGMSLILPRLASLVELYFLIPHSAAEFEDLITHLPSVEKVVIQRGIKLLDAIRILNKTPPPCPQLKYLYFKTLAVPKNIEKYANDVGRSLAGCIQFRKKESADNLEYIILGNCPPLLDTWVEKLLNLGTEVVSEKDAEASFFFYSSRDLFNSSQLLFRVYESVAGAVNRKELRNPHSPI